ncbi:flagellar FliJ family protein [Photobacterium kishitanii]|uniref:Flagellar FliJ protein n=1 Tax=Photobacterium kishitanii TaxID=318456 RepID=A0A2T3KMU4_9GAMM|nr:flagellar FliJ family protein [Photobacterium kishitanii]PSV01094.1 hypothetical protein C9J27_03485 [Photobacterium kishitanii]
MNRNKINSETKTLQWLLDQQQEKTANCLKLSNATQERMIEAEKHLQILSLKQKQLKERQGNATVGGDIANIFKYCSVVSESMHECEAEIARIDEELKARKIELDHSIKKGFSLEKLIEKKCLNRKVLEVKLEQKEIDEFACIQHSKKR